MREMKDSGIEWIGEIPVEWQTRKLFGLLEYIGSGTTPKGEKYYEDGNIPWLNTGDLTDGLVKSFGKSVTELALKECSALHMHKAGSIIIAMYGATIGKLGIANFNFVSNQACCVMQPGKILFGKYLFYLLWASKDYFIFLAYGAGQPNISQNTIKSLSVPVVDMGEQIKISNYLDEKCGKIDAVIEKQQAIIEKLKEYKLSLITEAVTKGLDSNVPMKDSGIEFIGEIPETWDIVKFGAISTVKSQLVSPMDYQESFQISPEHIEKNSGRLLEYSTVENMGVISNNNLFHKGDVLYTKIRPNLNKVVIAPFDGLCSAEIYPIETTENTDFVLYMLLSDYFVSQVSLVIQNRVKMPKINRSELSKIWCSVPSLEDQRKIVEYLEQMLTKVDCQIEKRQALIMKLDEYKKSLIYEVVTGKKEV